MEIQLLFTRDVIFHLTDSCNIWEPLIESYSEMADIQPENILIDYCNSVESSTKPLHFNLTDPLTYCKKLADRA